MTTVPVVASVFTSPEGVCAPRAVVGSDNDGPGQTTRHCAHYTFSWYDNRLSLMVLGTWHLTAEVTGPFRTTDAQ